MSPYWMLVPLIPLTLLLIVDWLQTRKLHDHEIRIARLEAKAEQGDPARWRRL